MIQIFSADGTGPIKGSTRGPRGPKNAAGSDRLNNQKYLSTVTFFLHGKKLKVGLSPSSPFKLGRPILFREIFLDLNEGYSKIKLLWHKSRFLVFFLFSYQSPPPTILVDLITRLLAPTKFNNRDILHKCIQSGTATVL